MLVVQRTSGMWTWEEGFRTFVREEPEYPEDPPVPVAPPQKPPGKDDTKEHCIMLYTACKQDVWHGPCDQCLLKCTAQAEWDFEMCTPEAVW